MNAPGQHVAALLIALIGAAMAYGQTASLGAEQRRAQVENVSPPPREAPHINRNLVYDRYSWTSVPPPKPKTFKVGDLITVIVRERRAYEADSALETKRRFNLQSDLEAFIKLTQGGVGAATFQRGKPNIDYKLDKRLKTEGDAEREDALTMRLTGKIIDVKPNGVLVLEARARIRHDDEVSVMTLAGTCRKEDVTADNTVLSTQLADKTIVVDNAGALRAASSRGWLLKIIDSLNPL